MMNKQKIMLISKFYLDDIAKFYLMMIYFEDQPT